MLGASFILHQDHQARLNVLILILQQVTNVLIQDKLFRCYSGATVSERNWPHTD